AKLGETMIHDAGTVRKKLNYALLVLLQPADARGERSVKSDTAKWRANWLSTFDAELDAEFLPFFFRRVMGDLTAEADWGAFLLGQAEAALERAFEGSATTSSPTRWRERTSAWAAFFGGVGRDAPHLLPPKSQSSSEPDGVEGSAA
ncbi:MAG: hypothetical protein HQL38_12400, partial [Alphaproteobacteria bacterium]|nr:hypothetical protein [Alphaproteobacteria bacterium]